MRVEQRAARGSDRARAAATGARASSRGDRRVRLERRGRARSEASSPSQASGRACVAGDGLVGHRAPTEAAGLDAAGRAHFHAQLRIVEHTLPSRARVGPCPGAATRTAALPPTSGSDAAVDVITGVPQAIASRTGRPKPSYRLGNAKSRAALYQSGNSSSGTKPRKCTSSCEVAAGWTVSKMGLTRQPAAARDVQRRSRLAQARIGVQQSDQVLARFERSQRQRRMPLAIRAPVRNASTSASRQAADSAPRPPGT